MMNTIELGIIEVYNSQIHGNKKLDGTYLVHETFSVDDFYDDEHYCTIDFLEENYERMLENGVNHQTIRNYSHLVDSNNDKNFHNLKLVQCYFTEDGEQLAVDKTYLISRIQRKWKSVLRERERIVRIRSNPREQYFKRATGKWSSRCSKIT